MPVFARNAFVNFSSVTYNCLNKVPLFYSPSTNTINPQNAASEIFRNAPVSAPLSVVDDVDAGIEEEVADAESPVSDGPDDADAAVWADAEEVVVTTASIFSRPAVIVTRCKALIVSCS